MAKRKESHATVRSVRTGGPLSNHAAERGAAVSGVIGWLARLCDGSAKRPRTTRARSEPVFWPQ